MNPSPALLQVPDPRQEDNFIIALANVRDFGAKGDGQTDDTAAFSRAIKSVVQKGGGTVYVPAGHYAVKGNLIVPKSVYLCGEWKNPDKHLGGRMIRQIDMNLLLPKELLRLAKR